jgi:lipoprotein LprG
MRRLALAAVVLLALLAGCTDDDDKQSGNGGTTTPDDPVALLTDAKKAIDGAASVHLVLTGRDIPSGAVALTKGDGVATHAPAFKGQLGVTSGGNPIDAEVVAVGGKVYVKPSFAPSFILFTPKQLSDLGAPDPAVFLDPAKGVSSLLPALKNPVVKGESRQGSAVLTEVTGTIAGSALIGIFPKAPKDKEFPATFKIDKSSKQLSSATVSGPFYPGGTSAYDLTLDKYGEQVEITKP